MTGRLIHVGRFWNDKINDYACAHHAHTIEGAKVQKIFDIYKYSEQNYSKLSTAWPITRLSRNKDTKIFIKWANRRGKFFGVS